MQKSTNPVRDATICRRRGRKEHGFQYFGMLAVNGTMADYKDVLLIQMLVARE